MMRLWAWLGWWPKVFGVRMKKWGLHVKNIILRVFMHSKVEQKIQFFLFQHEGFTVRHLPRGVYLVMGKDKVSKWISVSN